MKKAITAITILFPVLTWAQTNAFTIKGKIGKLNAPAKAYLYYESAGNYVQDSVLLKKGIFLFKGTIEQPYRGTFIIDETGAGQRNAGDDCRFNIYLEPGTIKIESP